MPEKSCFRANTGKETIGRLKNMKSPPSIPKVAVRELGLRLCKNYPPICEEFNSNAFYQFCFGAVV
jgi:hypothetical protein